MIPVRGFISSKQDGQSLGLYAGMLVRRLAADSLFRNSGFLMATTAVTALTGYVYWILAAHLYPAHDIGIASSLVSVMSLAANAATLGVGSTMVQELPRQRTDRAWSLTITAGLVACTSAGAFAGIIAALILPRLSGEFATAWLHAPYGILLIISVPLWSMSLLVDQVFVAERAAGHVLTRNTVFAFAKIALLALPFALIQMGAVSVFMTWILANAASVLGASVVVVRWLGHAFIPTLQGIGTQLRSMLTSLVGQHLISVGGLVPVYLLSVLVVARLTAADAGYFYTTWMLGAMFFMVSNAVATSLFAEASHNPSALGRKLRSSIKVTSLCLAPAMFVAFVAGREILSLFGPGYAQHSLILLWVLTASAIPDAVTNLYVSVLRVQKRLRAAAILNIGMASLTILLAWILLPVLGLLGAGVAWILGELAGCLYAGVDLLIQRHTAQRRADEKTGCA